MKVRSGRCAAVLATSLAGAVLTFGAVGRADGVPIEDATAAQLRAAQKTFEAADELYDGEQFESAIATFRTSYGIVASPNTRLMIARAMQKLGDLRGAYAELESAVGLAEKAATKRKKYEPTLKAVREELAVLRGKVGVLDLWVVEPTTIASLTVEDRSVDVAAISRPVIVTPGTVTVVARADGYADLRLTVDVGAGEAAVAELALTALAKTEPPPALLPALHEAPPEPARPSGASALRTAAWIAGAIGAAGFVGFAVLGASNNAAHSDLEVRCPAHRCPQSYDDEISSGRTLQTLANVGLGVGIAGLGTGVTLFVLDARKSRRPASTGSARLSGGGGTLRLAGSF